MIRLGVCHQENRTSDSSQSAPALASLGGKNDGGLHDTVQEWNKKD
jgi:hypothetical protein